MLTKIVQALAKIMPASSKWVYWKGNIFEEGDNLKHCKGRRLTREEKVLLKKQGYEPKDFLRTNKTAEGYEFIQVSTGKPLSIRR